jgi:hypothetical protein
MNNKPLGEREDFEEWADKVVSTVKKRRHLARSNLEAARPPIVTSLRRRTRRRFANLIARLTS